MGDDGWTAWDSFKDWVWQTLYTNAGTFLWTGPGKAIVTALIALASTAIAYLADSKHKHEVALVCFGGIGACALIFIWTWIQSKLSGSPRAIDASGRDRSSPIEHTAKPHEVIGFDYLPASPLQNGWKIGYLDKRIVNDPNPAARENYLKTRQWKIAPDAPTAGSALFDLDACAIDRDVGPNAALSRRIEFEANYINLGMFFVRVLLATRDGRQTMTKLIKFIPGSKKPYPTEQYEDAEYTVEIDDAHAPSLGQGWRKFVISLADETARSWGQDGWQYKELRMIRLRGKLGISPIRLY